MEMNYENEIKPKREYIEKKEKKDNKIKRLKKIIIK